MTEPQGLDEVRRDLEIAFSVTRVQRPWVLSNLRDKNRLESARAQTELVATLQSAGALPD